MGMKRTLLMIMVVFSFLAAAGLAQESSAKNLTSAPATPVRHLGWETYLDKVQGAWMGKMIGVTFGAPWEFRYQGVPMGFDVKDWPLSPTRMKKYLDEAASPPGQWTAATTPEEAKKYYINQQFVEHSIKTHPSFGCPDNDDLYINMLFLYCLRRHGINVDPIVVAHEWSAKIKRVWHANEAGLENIKKGIMPPMSGNPKHNLHADDIDFQIEADVFGMVSPGMPQVSNRFGDRMGHIMNYGDGVYGGMFIAAMYTQAFFAKNVREVVDEGLKSIPPQSQYAQLIRDVIKWHDENPHDWIKTWTLLQEKWGNTDHCPEGYQKPFNIDAKLNGGYVVIGLLYGDGDWYKTINYATRCGQDNDCNPANAAGILGTLIGAHAIPAEYRDPLHDVYWNESLADLPDAYEIDVLAEDTCLVGLKVLLANGGHVSTHAGKMILEIPVQEPQSPTTLEQTKWEGDKPVVD
jgi:hypothetical protein